MAASAGTNWVRRRSGWLVGTDSSVAERHGATASQIALAWLLARYERMLLIPGTTSIAHLEENLAAIDIELTEDDLAELDGVEQVGSPLG